MHKGSESSFHQEARLLKRVSVEDKFCYEICVELSPNFPTEQNFSLNFHMELGPKITTENSSKHSTQNDLNWNETTALFASCKS